MGKVAEGGGGGQSGVDPGHKAEPEPSYPKGIKFWIGIGFMVVSFGVFVLYLAIPFLPVSTEAMATMFVVGWIVSWGLFFLGTVLAGKEGYAYLKHRFRSWFRKS